MKVIIVGGVAGGATAAARIRRLDETAEITVFERSGYISYANCGLPYYIGDVITDPYDLEFKDLAIFCKKPGNSFTLDERAKVAFCRETRNKLAHNKVLPPEDARRILKL